MALEISFNNEIHKTSELPSTFEDLRQTILKFYKESLPTNYHLEYKDNNGDSVLISDEEAYKHLFQLNLKDSDKSLTIYLVPNEKDKHEEKSISTNASAGKKLAPPIVIQNKKDFEPQLPHAGETIVDRLEKGEAPSDESLPSSPEDYEEKVAEIKETIEEIKKEGVTDLQPKILLEKVVVPVIIENKEDFEPQLPHAGQTTIMDRLEKGEAPSDESLPSSAEDYEEKVAEINQTVKEIKKKGAVDLKPKIMLDTDSDMEPQPSKKIKPDSEVIVEVPEGKNSNQNIAEGQ